MDQSSKNILIVEDEEKLLQAIKISLEKNGWQTIAATTGKQAWDLIKQQKIDLIILDIILPHQDGLWLMQQLKADPVKKNLPVIVFTNLTEGEKVSQIVAQGVYRLLIKAETRLEQLNQVVKEIFRQPSG